MPKRPAPPPVEVPKETPSRSRRQASKEALKQMQLLLDDENEAVEIASDEDIIPVEPSPPPPPRKKYKLSHRKSSDGNVDREVLVLKSITNRNAENTLELDCWVEPLADVQKARIKKIQEEEKQIQSKLDSLISQGNAKVIHKGDLSTIIEISEYVQSAIQAAQIPPNATPVVLNNAIGANQSYQLVMDPRLKLIVGPVNQSGTASSTSPKVYQGKVQVAQNLHQTPTTSSNNQTRMRTRRGVVGNRNSPPPSATVIPTPPITTRSGLQTRSTPAKSIPPPPSPKTVTPTRTQIATRSNPITNKGTPIVKNAPVAKSTPPPVKKSVPVATPPPPATRTRQSTSASLTNPRPSEDNVEGGLSTGGGAGGGQTKKVVVDLTSEDGRSMPDSKEIAFNKLQGKTYPSLVVVARPHLRVQDVSVDRPKLDAKVKSVLMHAPTKFTEWLIQQGLVRSEQKCSTHTTTQLKLGMYSDVTKFPYSGGYVWISECCPHRFVSVFSGSLFEGSPHPPMVILKLLYHWACQTNIQNVTQWVKVDNLYVKGMFTWLRAITTVALHTHLRQLGGSGTRVEVGVISLGTTSQDGNQRQVKVEVLGVLETASKLIRLRAVEPQTEGDRNYKKRFSKILEPIQQWIHPESILVADLTVDKQTLHNMGFTNVIQSSAGEYGSNRQIMEYLRRIVPRMFQNTLSLLSRQIIQQFLDELVWREWFGTSSLQAFDNVVLHLAEQTRYDNLTLITRLNRVAQNPFKNWTLPSSITNTNTTPATKATENATIQQNQKKQRSRKQELNIKPTQQITAKSVQQVPVEINRPPKSISPDVPEQMVPLENYYYGTIDNYTKTPKITLNMKCPFCKSVFDNNIQLMNHLFKHAHNVSQDAQLCRYCLTSVPTANDLLKHIATSHPAETKFDNGFVCLICETQYMNPFILGKHMSKEHCPSELPYQCGTCGYRCSNHKQAIDHFYKTHDNGPTIQCPFCLKSTTVFTSSRNIHQNMNYFIQHLQKHQRKQFARRCGKCNLWFVQKDVLRDHQTRMHVSQRGKPRLVPWNAPRNGVMVPKSKMDKYPGDADVINFSTLTLNVPKNLMCKECNTSMDTLKHFPSFESCQNPNCQYSTCCTNAMQEHNAKCSKIQNPIEREKLPFEMFCICGYSDTDGNQMARHLAICERKSAYPSRTEAQAAIVTHSMLDVLGLVRKPDDTKKDEADVPLSKDIKGDKEVQVVENAEKMEVDEVKEKSDINEMTEVIQPDCVRSKNSEDITDDGSKTITEKEETTKVIHEDTKKEKENIDEHPSESMEIGENITENDITENVEGGNIEEENSNTLQEVNVKETVQQGSVTTEEPSEINTVEKVEKHGESREQDTLNISDLENNVELTQEIGDVAVETEDIDESMKGDVAVEIEDIDESVKDTEPAEETNENTESEKDETPFDASEEVEVVFKLEGLKNDRKSTENGELDEKTYEIEGGNAELIPERTRQDEKITDRDYDENISDREDHVEKTSDISDQDEEISDIREHDEKTSDIGEDTEENSRDREHNAPSLEMKEHIGRASEIDEHIEGASESREHDEKTNEFEEHDEGSSEMMESDERTSEIRKHDENSFKISEQDEVTSETGQQDERMSESRELDETTFETIEPDERIPEIKDEEINNDITEGKEAMETALISLESHTIEKVVNILDGQDDCKHFETDEAALSETVSQSEDSEHVESDKTDQSEEHVDEVEDSENLKGPEVETRTENISNHISDEEDSLMETSDIPVEMKPEEPDFTADDFQNIISDMVGDSVASSETDVSRYSNCEQAEHIDDITMTPHSKSIDVPITTTEISQDGEATAMETD